jgi:hypothetical protein
VDHGVDVAHRVGNRDGVSKVAPNFTEAIVSANACQRLFAVQVEVEDGHTVARLQELRNET